MGRIDTVSQYHDQGELSWLRRDVLIPKSVPHFSPQLYRIVVSKSCGGSDRDHYARCGVLEKPQCQPRAVDPTIVMPRFRPNGIITIAITPALLEFVQESNLTCGTGPALENNKTLGHGSGRQKHAAVVYKPLFRHHLNTHSPCSQHTRINPAIILPGPFFAPLRCPCPQCALSCSCPRRSGASPCLL